MPAKPKRTQRSSGRKRPASKTRPAPRRQRTEVAKPRISAIQQVRPAPRPDAVVAAAAVRPEVGVVFEEVTPSLAVRDVARSRAFYQRLGFRVAAQLPPAGPAEWLRLERDRVALLVWNEVIASPEILAAISQARGAGNAVRIRVSDLDRLSAQLVENGVSLRRPAETMPDGSRELSVTDPDGFVIEFAAGPRSLG